MKKIVEDIRGPFRERPIEANCAGRNFNSVLREGSVTSNFHLFSLNPSSDLQSLRSDALSHIESLRRVRPRQGS